MYGRVDFEGWGHCGDYGIRIWPYFEIIKEAADADAVPGLRYGGHIERSVNWRCFGFVLIDIGKGDQWCCRCLR